MQEYETELTGLTIQNIISWVPDFLSYFSTGLITVIRNDVVPFVGAGASDKGDDWFGVAHVEDFMWHARFNVNEIAGFVLQHALESRAEFVAHFSLQDVKNQFEADMDM